MAFTQVLTAIMILSVIVIYTQNEKYKLNSIEELNSLGEIIGQTSEPSLLFEQYNEIDNVLNNFKSKEKIDAIWVKHNENTVSKFKKDSTFHYPKTLTTSGLATEEGIFSKTEIISEGEVIGEVIVRSNLIQLENDIDSLYTRIIFSSTTLLLLLSIVAFITQNSISKPIIELSNVAREIKKGNLKSRAKVSSTDELNDLNEAFNQMIEQIIYEKQISDQLLKTRGQFFSNIGKISGSQTNELLLLIDSIKKENNISPYSKETFLDIESTTKAIANSIDDILALTSKNERQIKIQNRNYSLDELKKNILDCIQINASERNIDLIFESYVDQPFQIDPERLSQIYRFVFNLYLNDKESEQINIKLGLDNNILKLEYKFKDQSVLFNQLEKFQSLIQSKLPTIELQQATTFEELVIINILSLYKSTFELENNENETLLSISFQTTELKPNQLSSEEKNKLKGAKLLLVEPSDSEHDLMLEMFKKHQIEVISSKTGNDLFDIVKYNNDSIDIIISEEDLPISSASDAFKRILDEFPKCPPTIIYTSNSNEMLEETYEKLNITEIYRKPTDALILLRKIASMLP